MKFAILIDGGYARALAHAKSSDKRYYRPEFIQDVCSQCRNTEADYNLLRVLYYDAPPFHGEVKLPVSGEKKVFFYSDSFFRKLAALDYIAVRSGYLRFQAWAPKTKEPKTDEDYRPVFVQKGVDTRIAMDVATFCERKTVDRIVLLSGDTDMIPILKHARIAGLQTVLLQLPPPAQKLSQSLLAHCDFLRNLQWP